MKLFAVWTGLEPATLAVTGRYSNQLNYQTKIPNHFKMILTTVSLEDFVKHFSIKACANLRIKNGLKQEKSEKKSIKIVKC